jgi:2,4-dienoyl-CoA reductase-like NADH-dependent reductase (Old Yellow Enzyme family)/pyruvate/2-oxoglutarate dehydrogenase complex dihydrolipoamide dehydrogenase (E3) component
MGQLLKLFEPGRIGKLELPNRLIMAPMGTGGYDEQGRIVDRVIDYYVARAKGGVGLIIGQSSEILRESALPGRSWIFDDSFISRFRELTSAVHEQGGRIAWQLLHRGKALSRWLSTVEHPERFKVIGPQEASKEDIARLLAGYAEAARRVKESGFDAVEIHGAHGFLIAQWLSPRYNRRNDGYGGDAEKRARFACEVIAQVRKKVGADFPISFRFSGSDFIEGGKTLEDSIRQAPLFVEAGADALHVSAGETESFDCECPCYLFPDGVFVHLADGIKKTVSVPVIAVGKIADPLLAERILTDGKADFIAMGRALLADPDLPNKAREGRLEDIRRCIHCNNCHGGGWRMQRKEPGISCTINPAVMREKTFDLTPTSSPKRVMVVGGGLAGMEAARTLAERGHQVSLYERSDRLGGQWNVAAQYESKKGYARVTEYMSQGLGKAGVKVTLNKEVTRHLVEEIKPDVLVVATGAVSRRLDVPGVDGKNVVQAIDVLAGKATVDQRAVVIGGRARGMEVALLLAAEGKRVSLVTKAKLGEDGVPMERSTYLALRNRLIQSGVYLYTSSPVSEITDNGVYIEYGGELVFLEADTVVLAVGAASQNGLIRELGSSRASVYAIGDCVEPRDAMEAIRQGAEIGREI